VSTLRADVAYIWRLVQPESATAVSGADREDDAALFHVKPSADDRSLFHVKPSPRPTSWRPPRLKALRKGEKLRKA
jgi:hypothetical protein